MRGVERRAAAVAEARQIDRVALPGHQHVADGEGDRRRRDHPGAGDHGGAARAGEGHRVHRRVHHFAERDGHEVGQVGDAGRAVEGRSTHDVRGEEVVPGEEVDGAVDEVRGGVQRIAGHVDEAHQGE